MKNYEKPNEAKRNRNKKRKRGENSDDREELLKELDRQHINKTQLRSLRLQQLEQLMEDDRSRGENILRIADGAAIEQDFVSNRVGLLCDVPKESKKESASEPIVLEFPIACYICRKSYRELHFFYHQLCPDCAPFNYLKRNEMADLSGFICLVTGGRTKIGYQTVLKLLRCGAHVIITSRFPVDCAKRYLKEQDFAAWKNNLDIFGIDFRDLKSLEKFCDYLCWQYPYLTAIVNNAAQTVRRPPVYYEHLLHQEEELCSIETMDKDLQHMLKKYHYLMFGESKRTTTVVTETLLIANDGGSKNNDEEDSNDDIIEVTESTVTEIRQPMRLPSHRMTQLAVVPGDDMGREGSESTAFPDQARDVNGQQVDLRRQNSWTLRLHEVSTPELAEVFAINSIAPTVINGRLKPLMEKSPPSKYEDNERCFRFIINVSAMEGKFYRHKNDKHPHTNMAKAALNMMTRTSGQDYVKSRIYMCAVDTGWINDEKPAELAARYALEHNFQTPIDEIDAASRVLDPIISSMKLFQSGVVDIEPPFGVFLKDYTKSEW